jgi:hypothetical protein
MSNPPAPQLAELHRLIKRSDDKAVLALCNRREFKAEAARTLQSAKHVSMLI